MSITHDGTPTEARFRLITGACQAAARSDGDALLDGHLVELKYAAGGAVNQVRAVKYIPLVVQTPASLRMEMQRMTILSRAVTSATRTNITAIFSLGPTHSASLSDRPTQLRFVE